LDLVPVIKQKQKTLRILLLASLKRVKISCGKSESIPLLKPEINIPPRDDSGINLFYFRRYRMKISVPRGFYGDYRSIPKYHIIIGPTLSRKYSTWAL
jgi:hypothetical protein